MDRTRDYVEGISKLEKQTPAVQYVIVNKINVLDVPVIKEKQPKKLTYTVSLRIETLFPVLNHIIQYLSKENFQSPNSTESNRSLVLMRTSPPKLKSLKSLQTRRI